MNDDRQDTNLRERVDRLEAEVRSLHQSLEDLRDALRDAGVDYSQETADEPPTSAAEPVASSTPATPPSREQVTELAGAPSPPQPARRSPEPAGLPFELPAALRDVEWWLNKIGIGLFFIGLALLFKYSIDQGWLTPPVRVGIGVVAGLILLGAGIRSEGERLALAQVLLGGSVATFYITDFAAFQLYTLVPYTLAFAAMVAITLLAFVLSIRGEYVTLALIGVIGGLSTPFLLYTGEPGNIPGLVAYTCLVLTGAIAIYFYQDWRSLLSVSVLGGWIVFGITLASVYDGAGPQAGSQWALQAGVAFAWVAFWAVPVARTVLAFERPARWSRERADDTSIVSQLRRLTNIQVHILTVSIPLVALAFTAAIWRVELDSRGVGVIAGAGALVYAAVGWLISRRRLDRSLYYVHFASAVTLVTLAVVLILDGNAELAALALEATALLFLARRLDDLGAMAAGNALFIVTGILLFVRLLSSDTGVPVLVNSQALTDLLVIVLAGVASTRIRNSSGRWLYRAGIHVALLAWFWRELGPLEYGSDYTILAWSVQGIVLHALGRRLDDADWTLLGHTAFAAAGFWLWIRLLSEPAVGTPFVNVPALVSLAVIALAALVSMTLRGSAVRWTYRVLAHAALLAWCVRELAPLENSDAYTTAAWGLYGVVLLLAGMLWDRLRVRWLGLATILLMVAKLFLVDLRALDAFLRIILFLGFGVLFLIISYYFQSLWRPAPSTQHSE